MAEEWTVDNGLLTPTLKVKRAAIEARYTPQLTSWYATKAPVDVTGFATVTSVTGFVSVTVVTVTGSEEAAVTDTVFVTFTSEVPTLIIGMA